ncbi:MAG: zf-TFIIB domain-containing protein [Chitinophagales bacterium]|nr:zf-TFIIB domain-containing protein [Chitinophagales bacterium]
MNCPSCNTTLVMSQRQQVEIDYCPKCRGVWLDRGELDKIISRSFHQDDQESDGGSRYDRRADEDRRSVPKHYGKKRESFLSDLFDF